MKGCTDYTREAAFYKPREFKKKRPVRVAIILSFILLVVLIVFAIWPSLSGEVFSVSTKQVASVSLQARESLNASIDDKDTPADTNIASSSEPNSTKIVVYITGSVAMPGVLELDEGARLNDAIVLSGGLSENVAQNYVNLAAKLSDGMHIHIPSVEEVASGESTKIASASDMGGGESMASNMSGVIGNSKVNINTASNEQLQVLPGIGEATATKIISYREKNGPFQSIEDLKDVSGIGDKKYEDLVDKICV